ncbi:MAG: aldo/keto reductase [Promethearchaeota archaeon]
MRQIELGKTGEKISIIGIGTWGIKRFKSKEFYQNWIDSIRYSIDLGMNMIDTAEIYGNGQSEKIVGQAIKIYDRDDLFIATKVFPHHYGYKGVKAAVNRSLTKLNLKYIDLIQLHWPNPLMRYKRTVKALEELVDEGKVRYIGVSNFGPKLCEKFRSILKKNELVSNQVQISVAHQRQIKRLHDYAIKNGITLIAWSPFGHRGFKKLPKKLESSINEIAQKRNLNKYQVMLSWLTSQERVQAIPKSTNKEHIKANVQTADIILTQDEINKIYNVR